MKKKLSMMEIFKIEDWKDEENSYHSVLPLARDLSGSLGSVHQPSLLDITSSGVWSYF